MKLSSQQKSDFHNHIGKLLHQSRTELGISIEEAANRCHISDKKLKEYEEGISKNIYNTSICNLMSIFTTYNKSLKFELEDLPEDEFSKFSTQSLIEALAKRIK